MIEIYYQNLGNSLAVVLKSQNKDEILAYFNSFYNHEATDGELLWMNEGLFGYFWTTKERFNRALIHIEFNRLMNIAEEKFEGHMSKAWALARKRAKKRFESFLPITFIKQQENTVQIYSVRDGAGSEDDLAYANLHS